MATYYFRNAGTDYGTATNWSLTSGGTASGVVPTSADTAIFDSNSGACTVNGTYGLTNLTFTSYTNALTIIISGSLQPTNITISGNSVNSTNQTLLGSSYGIIGMGSGTITNNGLGVYTNFAFGTTTTLTSDFYTYGFISNGGGVTLNGAYTVYAYNNISFGNGVSGTFNGITVKGTSTLSFVKYRAYNLTIDAGSGTVTFNGTLDMQGINGATTYTYTSGTVVTTNSTFSLNTSATYTITLNGWSGITFNNVTFAGGYSGAGYVLNSDINVSGTVTFTTANSYSTSYTGTGTIYAGSITCSAAGTITAGSTVAIVINKPGTFNGNAVFNFNNNITFNLSGNYTMSGTLYYSSGTIIYTSGNIICNSTSTLYINSACTLLNIHKIPFRTVQIVGGTTVTMNQFFSGIPKGISTIQSTNTSNYTITFQNSFEKISNFIKISNCTLTRPLQLLITTKNANKGNNIGIRYINQLPNGIARKTTTMPTNLTGSDFIQMVGGLPNDPTKF